MIAKRRIRLTGIAVLLAFPARGVPAQFVPPAGFSGPASAPGVAIPTDPDAPRLVRLSDAAIGNLFRVDPHYARGHVKVVGAFGVAETRRQRFVAAWSSGFLPVTLMFADGRCYVFQADYTGGTLSNGRLNTAACGGRRTADEPLPPAPPSRHALRWIGTSWDYAAWIDDRAGTTIVTTPFVKSFQPLFTARMPVLAIMAMNGPDYPGGNVTLVGRTGKGLVIVTLEVAY